MCVDDVKTRLLERMRIMLMWMSVEVVSGVRIVLCHQVIDHYGVSTFLHFPLRVQILNLLSCCSNSSSLFPAGILCTRFAPRKHVILGVVFTPTVGYIRPLSAVNDPSVTK